MGKDLAISLMKRGEKMPVHLEMTGDWNVPETEEMEGIDPRLDLGEIRGSESDEQN